jgi:hypothetical protein
MIAFAHLAELHIAVVRGYRRAPRRGRSPTNSHQREKPNHLCPLAGFCSGLETVWGDAVDHFEPTRHFFRTNEAISFAAGTRKP